MRKTILVSLMQAKI